MERNALENSAMVCGLVALRQFPRNSDTPILAFRPSRRVGFRAG